MSLTNFSRFWDVEADPGCLLCGPAWAFLGVESVLKCASPEIGMHGMVATWLHKENDQPLSSVTQSRLTHCNPMGFSMPGFPVHHQLPELAQTVHPVGDAIQLFHPLSSPSPLAFNLSQQQGLFQGVSSLHQVAKVLELQLKHQSFT